MINQTRAAMLHLQSVLRTHFGDDAKSGSGQHTIYIGPDKIDLTDGAGTIVARGPARVATVVRRKRRPK